MIPLKRRQCSDSSHSVVSDSCDPMDWSPPGSSVLGIFQARILEWIAISFSRGSFRPRNWAQVPCIAGTFFTDWAMREAHMSAQSCPTLCDPMDCSPPGSSVHGMLLARILEWVAIPFSRGSFRPRNQTQISYTAGILFTIWVTRKVLVSPKLHQIPGLCP